MTTPDSAVIAGGPVVDPGAVFGHLQKPFDMGRLGRRGPARDRSHPPTARMNSRGYPNSRAGILLARHSCGASLRRTEAGFRKRHGVRSSMQEQSASWRSKESGAARRRPTERVVFINGEGKVRLLSVAPRKAFAQNVKTSRCRPWPLIPKEVHSGQPGGNGAGRPGVWSPCSLIALH